MSSIPKNTQLSEKISSLFTYGIPVHQNTLDFIESTYGATSVQALQQMLRDGDSCDARMLCELVLFPDEYIQMLLEPCVAKYLYVGSDVAEICRMVCARVQYVRITFPEDRENLRVPLSESAVLGFVQRLHITRTISPAMDQVLSGFMKRSGDYLKARVRLRHRRFEWQAAVSDALMTWIKHAYGVSDVFWDALDFLIDFFNTYPKVQDIESALMAQRNLCVDRLAIAEKNKKLLAQYAMETLVLTGTRMEAVCTDQIQKDIRLIDAICKALYGG